MLMWKIRKSKILSLHLLFWTMDQLLELQTPPLWHWHQLLLFSEVELFFCLFQSSYKYVDWLLFGHQSSPQSSFVHRLPLLHGFCLHPLLLLPFIALWSLFQFSCIKSALMVFPVPPFLPGSIWHVVLSFQKEESNSVPHLLSFQDHVH